MTNRQALLRVILPHTARRALPAYGNEVILVMKGSSLVSTITLMDLMVYTARLNAQTYDTLTVFTMAYLIYLTMTGVLTVLIRFMEHKVLAFNH